MTREEAKKINEALDIAIELLEQEPINDVLDKIKAEIMQVVNEEKSYDAIWALGLRYAVNIIDTYRKEQTDV